MRKSYTRATPGAIPRRPVWKCMNCAHYLLNPEDLVGRDVRCYTCQTVFEVKPQHLRTSGFQSSGLNGDKGWRAKIICDGDCIENLKKRSGLDGLSLQDLMKKSVKDALEPSRSESEQEKGLLADLVRQARGE